MVSTTLRELLERGLLLPDERLTLSSRGRVHDATLLADGSIKLAGDGKVLVARQPHGTTLA